MANLAKKIEDITERVSSTKLNASARDAMSRELTTLENLRNWGPEADEVITFIDCLLSLPWGTKSRLKKDPKRLRELLEDDISENPEFIESLFDIIVEGMNTRGSSSKAIGLLGGSTRRRFQTAKAIARATGREFCELSMLGVSEQGYILGNPRTHDSAALSIALKALTRCKTSNPVVLVDHIDQISVPHEPDMVHAMLEVFDPRQNSHFRDRFLQIEYDLSNVCFIFSASSPQFPSSIENLMDILGLEEAGGSEAKGAEAVQFPSASRETVVVPRDLFDLLRELHTLIDELNDHLRKINDPKKITTNILFVRAASEALQDFIKQFEDHTVAEIPKSLPKTLMGRLSSVELKRVEGVSNVAQKLADIIAKLFL
ncbi:AAA family ATPase [Roseobacter sp. EG26]|uniref:AAA family ATPase n=1 Tax=Roseobacter sp. EG26 TaxID=3412477 RepID=UPI003CE5584C